MITYRQVIEEDIPSLFTIRKATWHNDRGTEELEELGITSNTVRARLETDHAGWIAFAQNEPVGFAMGNRSNGELWVIAVLPEFEGQGIGRELMRQAEAWLFSHGWSEIWLTTSPDERVRAVGFYRHLGWTDWKIERDRYLKKANPRSNISLEEHRIENSNKSYSRLLRVQRGPSDNPHKLCLFLDGEHYWRDMDAIPLVNSLINDGILRPMTVACLGHVSCDARHKDYTCNENYAEYIGKTVMPWLKKEIPSLDDAGHVICGLSLSGLMATYLTIQYPQHFAGCLSQSGSHWWKHEWFAAMARKQERIDACFWLSVGDQETEVNVKHPPTGLLQEISQISGVRKTKQVLENREANVHYNEYQGGHSLQCWRDELAEALLWLNDQKKEPAKAGNS